MKIFLLGYYGYGNFGDELMRKGIEDFFQKFNIQYRLALPKRISKETLSRFNIFEIIEAIYESDITIYGGGGLLQDITSLKSFLYYASIIKLSFLFQKPVILFGNSLGPVKNKFNRFLLRKILQNSKTYFFSRDLISYKYAKHINAENTKLSCDPSIRYLKKISLEELKQSQEIELLLIPQQKKFSEQTEYIQQYDILKNYFSKIKVCPAQKTDEKIAKLIADRLGAEAYLNIDNVDNIISLILSSNLVISERFHPSVVAAYFGIPFISVENSKSVRFFRKYTSRKDFFANSILDIPKRIEIVKNEPLNLKNEMDNEADKSFNELYKLMIKLSSHSV